MKKNFKKLFAILMTVAVVLSMAMPVLAEDNRLAGATATDMSTTAPVGEKAPTTGTLNINGSGNYTAYMVFSAVVEDGDDTYTWKLVDGWELKDGKTIPTPEEIAKYNATQMKALADDLANASKMSAGKALSAGTNEGLELGYYLVVDNGAEGLTKSQPILVAIPQVPQGSDNWVYTIDVTPKASSTTFEKKIHEGDELKDTNTANIGDYVEYYLYADIPTYEQSAYDTPDIKIPFSITDKMSKELTWGDKSVIEVYTITSGTDVKNAKSGTKASEPADYSVDYKGTAKDTKGGTFTVDFTKKFMEDHKGEKVVVIFSAQLNEDAVIGATAGEVIDDYGTTGNDLDGNTTDTNYNGKGNPNAATLTYSNSYYGGEDVDYIDDTVTTFTFEIDVKKIEKESKDLLGGAEFKVYTDPGCADKDLYTNGVFDGTLTTGTEEDGDMFGKAVAKGVKNGTYYIKETKAPAGYKLYDGVITVEVKQSKDNEGGFTYTITTSKVINAESGETETEQKTEQSEVEVADEKGTTLPGTGGIGTTIFTFGGLALIVLAGILLVVYTRKQKKAKA